MKKTKEQRNLDDVLRAPGFVANNFMGHDARSYEDVIRADLVVISEAGRTLSELVVRMKEITARARLGMEMMVDIDEKLEARVVEARGKIPCPWPHAGQYSKHLVVVQRKDTGATIQWTELNLHLIEAHHFFEGEGALFRLDPKKLMAIIF